MSDLSYQGQIIQQRDSDGYVNATQMAKINNVLVNDFNRSEFAKKYLKALQESEGDKQIIVIESTGFPAVKTMWVHPLVAERFAQWIQNKKICSKSKTGVIYIFVDNGNNAYKIGFTTDLRAREKQHKTSNPFLELVKCYNVESIDTEQILHEKLKSFKIPKTTEWYKKHPDVLKIVKLICTNN